MTEVAEVGAGSSTPMIVEMTKAKSARTGKARADVLSHPLVKEAIREVRALPGKAAEIEDKRRQISFVVIGRLHELRGAATTDAALMENLERKSGIQRRKNTSDHLYVVKTVLLLAGSELKPQTASDWAKVLHGLELAGVPADHAKVVEWLCTPEEEADLSGHAKAFAVVDRAAKDGPPNVAAVARAAKQVEQKQKDWTDYLTPKLETPLGEITLSVVR